MTHGLSAEVQRAGGKHLARQSAEEWHTEFHKGSIRRIDIKYILWDWQLERAELMGRIAELEKENEQIVVLSEELLKTTRMDR